MASEIYFATKFRRKSSIGDHQIKKKEKKAKNHLRLSLFLSRRPITSSAQTP